MKSDPHTTGCPNCHQEGTRFKHVGGAVAPYLRVCVHCEHPRPQNGPDEPQDPDSLEQWARDFEGVLDLYNRDDDGAWSAILHALRPLLERARALAGAAA